MSPSLVVSNIHHPQIQVIRAAPAAFASASPGPLDIAILPEYSVSVPMPQSNPKIALFTLNPLTALKADT
jgi:hypothetical protein